MSPLFSASSIILTAILSLMEPPGFINSHLATVTQEEETNTWVCVCIHSFIHACILSCTTQLVSLCYTLPYMEVSVYQCTTYAVRTRFLHFLLSCPAGPVECARTPPVYWGEQSNDQQLSCNNNNNNLHVIDMYVCMYGHTLWPISIVS